MDFQHIIQPQFESMHGAAQFMVSACFYQLQPVWPSDVESNAKSLRHLPHVEHVLGRSQLNL